MYLISIQLSGGFCHANICLLLRTNLQLRNYAKYRNQRLIYQEKSFVHKKIKSNCLANTHVKYIYLDFSIKTTEKTHRRLFRGTIYGNPFAHRLFLANFAPGIIQ